MSILSKLFGDKLKVRARKQLSYPLHTCAGDTVRLVYTDEQGNRTVVAEDTVTETRIFTEGVIVDGEFEGKDALGGLLLGPKK
jgi:hypothetical protein